MSADGGEFCGLFYEESKIWLEWDKFWVGLRRKGLLVERIEGEEEREFLCVLC